jgi:pSer/pThr/pTyr-binding forkhead associated (FHA) protein
VNQQSFSLVDSRGTAYFVGTRGLSIGRKRTNDIVISEPTVGRRHAEVYLSGNRVFIKDSGMSITLLNGACIEGEREIRLGDKLTVGSQSFHLHVLAVAPSTEAGPPARSVWRIGRNQLLLFASIVALVLVLFALVITALILP